MSLGFGLQEDHLTSYLFEKIRLVGFFRDHYEDVHFQWEERFKQFLNFAQRYINEERNIWQHFAKFANI